VRFRILAFSLYNEIILGLLFPYISFCRSCFSPICLGHLFFGGNIEPGKAVSLSVVINIFFYRFLKRVAGPRLGVELGVAIFVIRVIHGLRVESW
jgi:hypothetical protein